MRNLLSNEWLTLACRLALGGIFLYAAWDKFLHPREFAVIIASYRVLPGQLINLFAVLLPALELTVAAFLVVGLFPRASALVMIGLMAMFIGAFAIATIKGVNLADCGCFSVNSAAADQPVRGTNYNLLFLLRDLGFLLPALQIFCFGRHRLALQNLWPTRSPAAMLSGETASNTSIVR